jgi:hypothetical protein
MLDNVDKNTEELDIQIAASSYEGEASNKKADNTFNLNSNKGQMCFLQKMN